MCDSRCHLCAKVSEHMRWFPDVDLINDMPGFCEHPRMVVALGVGSSSRRAIGSGRRPRPVLRAWQFRCRELSVDFDPIGGENGIPAQGAVTVAQLGSQNGIAVAL